MSLPDCDGWGSHRQNLRDYSARSHRVLLIMILHDILPLDSEQQALCMCTWRRPWQHSTEDWGRWWRRTGRIRWIMLTANMVFIIWQLRGRLFPIPGLVFLRTREGEERPWAGDRCGINLKQKPARGEHHNLQSDLGQGRLSRLRGLAGQLCQRHPGQYLARVWKG